MDTDAGAASADLGHVAMPGMNLQIQANNEPKFKLRFWEIKVKGQAFGGTVSRIEFASGTLEASQ